MTQPMFTNENVPVEHCLGAIPCSCSIRSRSEVAEMLSEVSRLQTELVRRKEYLLSLYYDEQLFGPLSAPVREVKRKRNEESSHGSQRSRKSSSPLTSSATSHRERTPMALSLAHSPPTPVHNPPASPNYSPQSALASVPSDTPASPNGDSLASTAHSAGANTSISIEDEDRYNKDENYFYEGENYYYGLAKHDFVCPPRMSSQSQ